MSRHPYVYGLLTCHLYSVSLSWFRIADSEYGIDMYQSSNRSNGWHVGMMCFLVVYCSHGVEKSFLPWETNPHQTRQAMT